MCIYRFLSILTHKSSNYIWCMKDFAKTAHDRRNFHNLSIKNDLRSFYFCLCIYTYGFVQIIQWSSYHTSIRAQHTSMKNDKELTILLIKNRDEIGCYFMKRCLELTVRLGPISFQLLQLGSSSSSWIGRWRQVSVFSSLVQMPKRRFLRG